MTNTENRVRWVMRTEPPVDGSSDDGLRIAYLRRARSSEWRAANPVLADREVVYESDTDTFIVGDDKTTYTGLPRYVRQNNLT